MRQSETLINTVSGQNLIGLNRLLFDVSEAKRGEILLVEEETRWTYQAVQERVLKLASALKEADIQPGDRIALMFYNQKEYLLGFFAGLLIDAVVVPINLQMGGDDIAYVMQNAGIKLVLCHKTFAEKLSPLGLPLWVSGLEEKLEQDKEEQDASSDQGQALSALTSLSQKIEQAYVLDLATLETSKSPEEIIDKMAVLMYTSGTTGRPKGVMLSEANLLSNIDGVRQVLNFSHEDSALLALPLFHAFGLMIGLYLLSCQAKLVLVPKFAPKKMVQAVAQEKVTLLPLVPTMFSLILEAANKMGTEPFQSLKACISGGASLPSELLKRIESTLNVVVLEGYGLTETSPVLAVNCPKRGSIPKSVGKPLPNLQMKLVKDNGEDVSWQPGEVSAEGEIWVNGPNVMRGYYNLPEATAEVLDEQGWFKTGDLGHFDGEGNLFISGGRKKDLIIKAGENISPMKIEEVLYKHPAILEASVIGVPDAKVGEEILACLQFKEGQSASDNELKKFCLEHLPSFLIPGAYRIYEELPKNQTGKILKKVLREQNPSLF
jgi:long-chain acyl-CoA synthetase